MQYMIYMIWIVFFPVLLQRQCSNKFIFWIIGSLLKYIHTPTVNKSFNK